MIPAPPSPQRTPIRSSYFLRIPNAGDRINPTVIAAASGRSTVLSGRTQAHLLAIGSIMSAATPTSIVWGSGVMHPDIGVGAPLPENIRAVRGPLSLAALRDGGLRMPDMPLGDPAVLAPGLLGIERSGAPRFRVGLVPHYVDRHSPPIQHLLQQPEVADLNVHDDPAAFLRRMAECAVILSTSLHGLIFAEALGIPNLWLKASDAVAGDGFKFRDWFATTARPQQAPRVLKGDEIVADLSAAAVLHDSTIDKAALLEAFPLDRIDELSADRPVSVIPAEACRVRPLPVFFISFNRAALLRRAISGVRRQRRPTEIVIHDNGSDDADTIALLAELEGSGVRVFRHAAIHTVQQLNLVNDTVSAFFADWGEPSRYVVSDCDIDVSVAAPTMLDMFDDLLNRHRRVQAVGPMLRIRDIPRAYPLHNMAINRHVEQFWQHEPTIERGPLGEIAFIEARIDTTFALHRAGEPFTRLKKALRVYEPYEALHLDWYRTGDADDAYARRCDPAIAHWSNRTFEERHRNRPLDWDSFKAVRVGPDGRLEVYRVAVEPGSPAGTRRS